MSILVEERGTADELNFTGEFEIWDHRVDGYGINAVCEFFILLNVRQ